MSNGTILEIINILEEETGVYLEFLSLSKDKKQFLIDGNTKELDRIIASERSLIASIVKFEKSREEIVIEIAKEMNLSADDINISGISKKIGKEFGDKLNEKAIKLNRILAEIKSINNINKELINQSIDYIDFSLNMLTSIGEVDNSYGNSGAAKAAKNNRLFNKKI